MTGPEHYRKAEELAEQADKTGEQWYIDLGLLHASLARTAAIAMSNRLGMPEDAVVEWDEACRIPDGVGDEDEPDED